MPPDASCTLQSIDVRGSVASAIEQTLAVADEPLLLRGIDWVSSLQIAELTAAHGDVPVQVVSGSAVIGPFTSGSTMRLAQYVDSLRDRALPADAYVFSTLDKRSQVLPELQPFFERIVALQHPALASLARPPSVWPDALRGHVRLALGADRTGNGWHAHGAALNVLLAGSKRWLIAKRRLPAAADGDPLVPDGRKAGLATGVWLQRFGERTDLDEHVWRCVQRPGELVFVPSARAHAVINEGGELTLALSVQHDRPVATPLHAAAYAGHLAAATALLAAGDPPPPEQPPPPQPHRWLSTADPLFEETPLVLAAQLGHADLIRVLLAHGAKPTDRNWLGQTPLHAASERGQRAAAELLVVAGAPLEAAYPDGKTPLHVAALNNHTELVVELLLAGARTEAAEHASASTSLHWAAARGLHAVAAILVEFGADVDAAMSDGNRPAHLAAQRGHIGALKALAAAGAALGARNARGETPRDVAVAGGHAQAAALLAKRARKPLAPSSPPSASTGTSGALPAAAMLEAAAADKTEL